MTEPWDAEVLIVGAGPVGLMLACELRLWGMRVLVGKGKRVRTLEGHLAPTFGRASPKSSSPMSGLRPDVR